MIVKIENRPNKFRNGFTEELRLRLVKSAHQFAQLNGNGFTMKNFSIAANGSYTAGLFRGDSNGANTNVFKNLNIEDVSIDSNDENQGYAGVFFGDVQGATVSFENVHVSHAYVKGVQSVAGLVGFVTLGSGTFKNLPLYTPAIIRIISEYLLI